jgi:hypothetical protein
MPDNMSIRIHTAGCALPIKSTPQVPSLFQGEKFPAAINKFRRVNCTR